MKSTLSELINTLGADTVDFAELKTLGQYFEALGDVPVNWLGVDASTIKGLKTPEYELRAEVTNTAVAEDFSAAMRAQLKIKAALWDLVESIRNSEEGFSLVLCNSNPDPRDDTEREAVEVNASWTNWDTVRYTGESVQACLLKVTADMGAGSVASGKRVLGNSLTVDGAAQLAVRCIIRQKADDKAVVTNSPRRGEPYRISAWMIEALLLAARGQFYEPKVTPRKELTNKEIADLLIKHGGAETKLAHLSVHTAGGRVITVAQCVVDAIREAGRG